MIDFDYYEKWLTSTFIKQNIIMVVFKGTVMQIEKAKMNGRLRVSNVF